LALDGSRHHNLWQGIACIFWFGFIDVAGKRLDGFLVGQRKRWSLSEEASALKAFKFMKMRTPDTFVRPSYNQQVRHMEIHQTLILLQELETRQL
jgi:hypothetical protein